MVWSAAGEKTLSNWYVLLLRAFGPMDRSTVFPLMPSVDTTTPLFSRTSRSLRPRHRTTTLILVSSPPSFSKSRCLRLVPVDCAGEERILAEDATESAREVRPSCAGVSERPRGTSGGRIEPWRNNTFLPPDGADGSPGRGRPDILKKHRCVGGKSCGIIDGVDTKTEKRRGVNNAKADPWSAPASFRVPVPTRQLEVRMQHH
jgi:hypothetical protein